MGAGGGEIPAAGRGYDGLSCAGVTEEWRGCDGALLRGVWRGWSAGVTRLSCAGVTEFLGGLG